MTNIALCKKCKKRGFDLKQGIVCSLTNEKPNFEGDCPYFENDEKVKEFKGLGLRPNDQRAKVLLALIWIVLLLEMISLVSSALQYNLLQTVSNGGEISMEAANANDLREQTIGILYLIAYIISGITFIMWFRRAYYNLHQRVKNLSCEEGWAAGSWFVPVVNLYRPFQIMKELYEETKHYLISGNNPVQPDLSTRFLGLWWALWIINGIIGQIIFRLYRNADTLPELLTSTSFDMISGAIGVGLGFVTIKVIKDYSNAEGLLIINT
ncbi:MAG: DUF4328 domain-containing protein [Bacteroidales bacterium]|nr:DUF4328 domain-containing protein [Bacteroidales bacterium]